MPPRSLRLLLLTAVTLAAGCSLVISHDATISCQSDEGCAPDQRCAVGPAMCISRTAACTSDSCESGSLCDPDTLACVPSSPASSSGTSSSSGETDAGGSSSSSGTPPPPPAQWGQTCSQDEQCSSLPPIGSYHAEGRCIPMQLTGGGNGSVCSATCCSSEQCPSDYYCAQQRSGNRFCVPLANDGRPQGGSKRAGETCAQASECRSGECDDPTSAGYKVCLDTCCSDANCAFTGACVIDAHYERQVRWLCAAAVGHSTYGTTCSTVDQCRSSACIDTNPDPELVEGRCTQACCSNLDCTNSSMSVCGSSAVTAEGGLVNSCTRNVGQAPGANCNADAACASGMCIGGVCASVCCTDANCDTRQGERCVASATNPRLHCAKVATAAP